MSYQQLTLAERRQIYALRHDDCLPIRTIARLLNRHPSTVSRELHRNQADSRYLPDTAQVLSAARRQQSKAPFLKVSLQMLQFIKRALAAFHSPQQLAGRLKRAGETCVSHETIYQMIYANHQDLGSYQKYLRQGRPKRRRRGGSKSKRGQIVGRVDIDERPAIADLKVESGHWGSLGQRPWEGDTVIGANQHGGVVTLVDKCSKYLLAELIGNRKATGVRRVCERLLKSVSSEQVKTITFDNGKEFSQHEKLSEAVGAACYFAKPYHSWERGLNEHTNGLLRQFFAKSTNFWTVKAAQLKEAVDFLNDRPRKSLGYQTPREVFWGESGPSCTSYLKGPNLNNWFLAYWFVANKNMFLAKTTESTHGTKRFDMKDIYELHIGIPSDKEQSSFLSRLNSLSAKLELEQASLNKLKKKKSGLMHDLLTGKVPINADPE